MFRRLQGHHQRSLHRSIKGRHKSWANSVKNVRVPKSKTTVSIKITKNFKNISQFFHSLKSILHLLTLTNVYAHFCHLPCVVCLVFMPCGQLRTVSKIWHSYSTPSGTPVHGLLHELNNNAVRSQLCSQDWSHRQGIMSTEIGHLAHRVLGS
jgi:hypothetical protein